MRPQYIALVAALLWLSGAGIARAEMVESSRRTRVLARPGERAPVVTRLPPGQAMTVVGRKGRWLKVRVAGETGWVTQTSVTEARSAVEPASRRQRRKAVAKSRRRAIRRRRASQQRRRWRAERRRREIRRESVGEEEDADEDNGDDDARAPRGRVSTEVLERRQVRRSRKRSEREVEPERDDKDDDDAVARVRQRVRRQPKADRDERGGAERREARVRPEVESDPDEPAQLSAVFGDEDSENEARRIVVARERERLFVRASTNAPHRFIADAGDRLAVIRESASGRWLFVEDRQGDSGWIRKAAVQAPGAGGDGAVAVHAHAAVGYTALAMRFQSDGVGLLRAYNLSSGAAGVTVGGAVIHEGLADRIVVGVDLRASGARAAPGIRYNNGANMTSNTTFAIYEVDAGARLGYQTERSDGLAAHVRVGYHYDAFSIDNVGDFTSNLALLPSESLLGPTVGLRLAAPRLGERLAATVGADLLLLGSRKQTLGLEDGARSAAAAAWFGANATVRVHSRMSAVASYRLTWAQTSWQGVALESQRPHAATWAERTDIHHHVSIGLGASF